MVPKSQLPHLRAEMEEQAQAPCTSATLHLSSPVSPGTALPPVENSSKNAGGLAGKTKQNPLTSTQHRGPAGLTHLPWPLQDSALAVGK